MRLMNLTLAALVLAAAPLARADVTLENASTRVVVNGGEANNGLIPSDGYFNYFALDLSEETTWSVDPVLIAPTGQTFVLSNGLLSSPALVGGAAVSTATTGGVTTTATTTLVADTARTQFAFAAPAGATLSGWRFVFHAENDLFSFTDDVATFTGSIAGGDLRLFQFDSAVSDFFVRQNTAGLASATELAFGAGTYTGFGAALEDGDLSVLSADGGNFATSGDLGLAHAYALAGGTALVTVDYLRTAAIPEPSAALALAATALVGLRRRRHA